MLVDGNAIARAIIESLKLEVEKLPTPPTAVVFTCEPTFETEKFLGIKKRLAADAGIVLKVVAVPQKADLAAVAVLIDEAAQTADSIIIQLPFPHLGVDELIPLIPPTHDADVFGYAGGDLLPPVIGAIDEIALRHNVSWTGKRVVIVGQGRLVGKPAATYVAARGGEVVILTKETFDPDIVKTADILILGAGVPGLITDDMVKAGVVVFDAGTSEMAGQLSGDADKAVANKAALCTPVPGGIGPVAVAKLLQNVLECALLHRKSP